LAAVTAAGGVGGAGPADAGPDGITLRYTCSMPLFPTQPMTVRLSWNAPKSVPVGRHTPIVPVTAVATMGDAVTKGLDVISAATVEGRADATGVVAAPEGSTPAGLALTVPKTDVPKSGPITVVASGKTPVFVFHRAGHATITVGSAFAVRLTPKTADGGSTFLDQVNASCTLTPGQDTVLTSFEITPPRAEPAPGRTAKPAAGTGGGSIPSGKKAPAAPRPSGSAAAGTPSTAPSSGVSVIGDTGPAATHGTALTTVSATGLAAAVAPWLALGVALIVGAVLGCVWWLRRRHRRGQGDLDSL
jgi:hypothetical protein